VTVIVFWSQGKGEDWIMLLEMTAFLIFMG